ncbi:ATPase domain protein, prokaryote domain protein [Candidatus Magnetomorum sp. HK-1]|nr:ATPase domain protein, prokaryote domain protein [Candidatus Magnetomorum sp. HK-1]
MYKNIKNMITSNNYEDVSKRAGLRIGWLVEAYNLLNPHVEISDHKEFIRISEKFKQSKKNFRGFSKYTIERIVNGEFSGATSFERRRDALIKKVSLFSDFSNIPMIVFIDRIKNKTKEEEEFKKLFVLEWGSPNSLFKGKSVLERSFVNLPATDNILFGRDSYLNLLDQIWTNNETNIVVLVASGGVGKTSLLNKWLLNMKLQDYKGAEIVYGYSFYKQGVYENTQSSANEFIKESINFFSDYKNTNISEFEKGRFLANLIGQKRSLFVLDGLEPLQYPIYGKVGQIKDTTLVDLLKGLASYNKGLCIITTRVKVVDIKHLIEPEYFIDLENISEEAGIDLLRSLGIKNTEEAELRKAVGEFGCHALALKLLGNYLRVVHNGDIYRRHEIPVLMDEKIEGGHAKRIMQSYEKWLKKTTKGKRALEILYMMGLFDRPATRDAIDCLLYDPSIEGLTDNIQNISSIDWKYTIDLLRTLGLFLPKDTYSDTNEDSLDCHPLVREFFRENIKKENPDGWMEAQRRLEKHYSELLSSNFQMMNLQISRVLNF